MELWIIGFGPVAGYKYSRCIQNAIMQGHLSRYHIIDRECQQQQVKARVAKLPVQPASCTYIPERALRHGTNSGIEWLVQQGLFTNCGSRKKIVITTEPQSHDAYISHALVQHFDILVAKPLILPMRDGVLDHKALMPGVNAIVKASIEAGVNAAMLCLGRCHEVFEKKLRQPVAMMVHRLQTPITSVHIKTASGVWNLPSEFGQREDHPYKYGYGMLMHGAYHYIDILARLLLLNRQLFPEEKFFITLQGYSAGPYDQQLRIGKLGPNTSGYRQEFSELEYGLPYGETDIVASYALRFRSSGRVLTLGTISLEQTTPGLRSWGPFPELPYNINGRLHCTDIDVRLGTAFSIAANVTKYPIQARLGDTDVRGVNSATIVTRANARIAGTQGFIRQENFERPYGNSYSYTAETEIFERWLQDKPTHSDLQSHLPSCAILDGLLKLAADDWRGDIEIDFNYPAPECPTFSQYDDPWYAYMAENVAFSSEHLTAPPTPA